MSPMIPFGVILKGVLFNFCCIFTRLAGSHLDIKTQFRKSPSQMARFSRLPVLHINATFNNTVITIADKKGDHRLQVYIILSPISAF